MLRKRWFWSQNHMNSNRKPRKSEPHLFLEDSHWFRPMLGGFLFILKGFLLICNWVLVIFSGVAYKFLLVVGPSSCKRFLLICKRVLMNFSGVPHNLNRILIHHNKIKRNINRIEFPHSREFKKGPFSFSQASYYSSWGALLFFLHFYNIFMTFDREFL